MAAEPEVKVKSIKKTVDVLNCFVEKQPLGVTEISEKLGLYKSNVYGILSTLAAMDYLEQDKETGKYYLGLGILKLSHAVGDRFNFRDIATAYMKQLADEVEEIVYLTVPMNREVYYLDTVYPPYKNFFMVNINAGSDHMHCTSCGKAMMAYMPDEFVQAYFSGPVEQRTEHTITDLDAMRAELQRIRMRGYAIDDMEADLNVRCVGVPIIARNHTVLGALSISGSSRDYTDEYVQKLGGKLMEYAQKIENAI